MRNVEAQVKVEPCSPAIGTKGELQQAWFRVKGIPADQRSVRTVAKVGGLVGKVMEIDEKTRFKLDYVRMRIACRDITKVPRTAESTLGLFIHDFSFEREINDGNQEDLLKNGIRIGEGDQPPHKKSKTDIQEAKSSHAETAESSGRKLVRMESGQGCKEGGDKRSAYALAKAVSNKRRNRKFMSDAQKSFGKNNVDEGEDKVHTPEILEESESESESFSEKWKKN